MRLECAEEGNAAVLTVTPNDTWPDVVYYNSYTHPYMGWRINIVDDFNQRFSYASGAVQTSIQSKCVAFAIASFAIFLTYKSII